MTNSPFLPRKKGKKTWDENLQTEICLDYINNIILTTDLLRSSIADLRIGLIFDYLLRLHLAWPPGVFQEGRSKLDDTTYPKCCA